MKRNAKKLSRALLLATLVVTVLAISLSALDAQAPQSSSSGTPPATATLATVPSSAKPNPASSPSATSAPKTRASGGSGKQQTSPTENAGMVEVNTETGASPQQGTRWYGKTKQGQYML
jgi:hypothetical protein